MKNYNDPTENDDPNFVTDSTTILLSGVSNLALNGNIFILKIYELCQLQLVKYRLNIFPLFEIFVGGQTKLPAPQTLAGGTKGRHPSDKGGVLFGRSESFKTNEHLGKCKYFTPFLFF